MPGPKQNTKRTLLGNSTYIFLIRVFPALASLLVLIVFSRHFDTKFFGTYQGFWVRFQVYSSIATIGIPALLLTYPIDKLAQLIGAFKWKSLAVIILWIVLAGIAFSFGLFSQTTAFVVFFAIAFLLVNALIAFCEAYLMVGQRFGFICSLSVTYAVFFLAIHGLLLYNIIEFAQLLILLLLGCIIRCTSLLFVAFHTFRRTSLATTKPITFTGIRSLWFHLGLYDIIQTVFRWADKFILSYFLGRELFAVYVNGTVDFPFLPILLGAVGSALLLHLGENDTSDADRIGLLRQSSSKLALIVFPLFFFFIFFRHEIFSVVFKDKYAAAVPLFLISSLVIPLRAYNFTSILQFKGKGKIINIGAILDLAVALILMYPLYLLWRLNGVALSFVISTYLQALFYLWHSAKTLNCSIWDLVPIKSWLVSFTAFLLVFFIGHFIGANWLNTFYTLLLGCGLMSITLFVILVQQLQLKRKR